ncbi:MAG: pantoate kinase [Candidatus Thorarchaeota archaeon]
MTDTLNTRDDMPMTAQAFVPGHITGVFRIFDEKKDPLECGSTGAGFSVEIGTLTTVSAIENESLEITTIYNDENIDANVTKTVVKRLVENYERQFKVIVTHKSSLPSGVGFGASGAGALGTALALGHLLNSSMSETNAAAFAHCAEVVNHTGLGDVIAQTLGGIEIRTHPGAPGVGKVVNIPKNESQTVVLAGAPGLKTRDVLTNPENRARINAVGDDLVRRIIDSPSIETFISCSREFTESIGLSTDRVKASLRDLDDSGLNQSSMVMLGDSVFCFCDDHQSQTAVEILMKYWDTSQIQVTSVSEEGGRLVSW